MENDALSVVEKVPRRTNRSPDDPVRVLLVEDNPTDAMLVEHMLRRSKRPVFRIDRADRLSKALDLLSRDQYDVVLLDLLLPDSYGIDTLDKMYNHQAEVPIVVLTGVEEAEFALPAVDRGAQDYLVKGQIQGDGLVRAIRYAMDRHSLLSEIEWERKRLLEANDLFREVFQNNSDAFLVVGEDGRILFASDAAEAFFERPPQDLVGQPFGFAAVGDTTSIDIGLRDGHTMVAELRVASSRWNGRPVSLVSLRDVTSRPSHPPSGRRPRRGAPPT